MASVQRFLETFETVRRSKRWGTHDTVLRFAALALASTGEQGIAAKLEPCAERLRRRAGWFSPLRSPVRYAVAALIVANGLRPESVHDSVREAREEMRRRRVPRGSTAEVMAAFLLAVDASGTRVSPEILDRFERIYRGWKDDHRFLTGADDYPMAALHATRNEEVGALVERVEAIYRGLNDAGFSSGNALQLASHLSSVSPHPADELVARFVDVAERFRQRGVRPRQDRYDEIALTSLLVADPASAVHRVLTLQSELRASKPRPSASLALTLAVGLALSEQREKLRFDELDDVPSVQAAQAAIAAQSAAVVAACAASVAATAAAAGS